MCIMKTEWESMTADELFALRELMHEVLSAKLGLRGTAAREDRLQDIKRQSKLLEAIKPTLQTLLVPFGQGGCAWLLLPLVSSL